MSSCRRIYIAQWGMMKPQHRCKKFRWNQSTDIVKLDETSNREQAWPVSEFLAKHLKLRGTLASIKWWEKLNGPN